MDDERAMLRQLFAALVVTAITAASAPAQKPAASSEPPPGVLVDIGGHKLHLRCAGPADARPTVILEAGGGGSSKNWMLVQDALPSRIRSCSYDRAGLGWSEAGPRPRTMRQEVFELRALLKAANVPGPYVLVGHSIGGLLVRLFTQQYGEEVAGVVLVDATHENTRLFFTRQGQWLRVREQATGRRIPEPQTTIPSQSASAGYDPAQDYIAEEFQQIYLARKENPQPLGDRPLFVLAGGKANRPPGASDELWTELSQEKREQGEDLARLSRNSKFVRDPASGHGIPTENPRLVAQTIEEVVDAAVRGTRLVP